MDHSALSTVVASGHPLIDIDWTAALQFILFVVTYLVANRLLFQPYLDLRSRRKAGIDGARSEAERMTAEADAKLADYEKQLAVARNRAAEEGRKIRGEAVAHEREVTDKARATAQTAIDEAQAKMRAETETARGQLMPQANALASQMASRLLGREVS
jgi:F-type H+-transporting ATPase subunit b